MAASTGRVPRAAAEPLDGSAGPVPESTSILSSVFTPVDSLFWARLILLEPSSASVGVHSASAWPSLTNSLTSRMSSSRLLSAPFDRVSGICRAAASSCSCANFILVRPVARASTDQRSLPPRGPSASRVAAWPASPALPSASPRYFEGCPPSGEGWGPPAPGSPPTTPDTRPSMP
eukprot:4427553-Pyramimonas_sp.AAC.1